MCARLLREAGRTGEALACLEGAFAKTLDPGLFRQIRTLGGEAARDRALGLLGRAAAADTSRWGGARHRLVALLVEEGLHDRAWNAYERFGCDWDVLMKLARACEASHTARVVPVYVKRTETLAEQGGAPAYAEAADLVRRLATLRPEAEHAAFVAELKTRHKRRRKLIAALG